MKTSQNQHVVRSVVLVGAIAAIRRELSSSSNATIRNQLELIDVVASELRELAAMPEMDEPERHPLYVAGKMLAETVLDTSALNGRRRAAARVFLEIARVRVSEKSA